MVDEESLVLKEFLRSRVKSKKKKMKKKKNILKTLALYATSGCACGCNVIDKLGLYFLIVAAIDSESPCHQYGIRINVMPISIHSCCFSSSCASRVPTLRPSGNTSL